MILLLFACGGAPDDSANEACEALGADDRCCREPTDTLWACVDGLTDQAATGTFAPGAVDPDWEKWTLTLADGSTYDVGFYGSEAARSVLPDLAAFGEVSVVNGGGCGSDGEGSEVGVFTVLGSAGETLLAVGSSQDDAAGAVVVSRDDAADACPDRPADDCFARVTNYPVNFVSGADTLELYQGQSGELPGMQVHLLVAMAPASDSTCDDVGGNMINWVIVGD